jgi:hypothetical protein
MKQVLCIAALGLLFSGCGMIDMPSKMDKTNENMEKMINNMDHTNDGIDQQKQLIPFENMLKPENTANLFPIPTRMLPFGKKLAEAIPAQDFVELAYLWLKEVDEVLPAHKLDAAGNEVPYTQDEILQINHDKTAVLMGLQIVAGFLPQQRVQEMIESQIYGSGRYEDTVYMILMLRLQFTRDILLDGSLLSKPLANVGKVAQAVEYNKNIDFIAKLPFAAKIGLKTTGFIPADESPVEKLDTGLALKNWERIQRSAERDCDVTTRGVDPKTGNPAEDQRLHQKELNQYNQAMGEIQNFISSWPHQD